MSKKKVTSIGLIVEDNSDFDSFKTIIRRILNKDNLSFKKAIGNGCGKLKRKASSYASTLSQRGCEMVILVHDLDRNNLASLETELKKLMEDSPAPYNFVCIPIEEIEGWFLSDTLTIKEAFNLLNEPRLSGNPELIKSPKEKLAEIIYLGSNKSKRYLNTKHNLILSEKVRIEEMKSKCPSFRLFCDFLLQYEYK
ncbi:DUF4276 family protein [Adhaeribacter rhizoryzae]|uniref:DUF4276 family protein n=1 Tax=Adhaeribacter rhizoryzae TaxID=2607907 RepID=UPI001CC1FB46|nr:DUF4276 family protein [Adhaeribacter rhizoryzae]